jgi:hypothetical protein
MDIILNLFSCQAMDQENKTREENIEVHFTESEDEEILNGMHNDVYSYSILIYLTCRRLSE